MTPEIEKSPIGLAIRYPRHGTDRETHAASIYNRRRTACNSRRRTNIYRGVFKKAFRKSADTASASDWFAWDGVVWEVDMRDDPNEIARNLIREHGLGRARRIAVEGTSTAKEEGDNYGLSVWREIKQVLVKNDDPILPA